MYVYTKSWLGINCIFNFFMTYSSFEPKIIMWSLEKFKVNEILHVTIFDTICSPNFALNHVHHNLQTHMLKKSQPVHLVERSYLGFSIGFEIWSWEKFKEVIRGEYHTNHSYVACWFPKDKQSWLAFQLSLFFIFVAHSHYTHGL